jgi:hypothetical protein
MRRNLRFSFSLKVKIHFHFQVRFLYLLSAPSSEILLEVIEKNPNYRRSGKRTELWRDFRTASGQKMDVIPWTRVSLAMPHMTHQYELQFTFSPTFRPPDPNTRNRHIIGLDNISLSKECFGIGIPFLSLNDKKNKNQ